MRIYSIEVGDLVVKVEHKPIRNLHLRIKPSGAEASAPLRVSEAEVRSFVLSKAEWIRDNLAKVEARGRRLEPHFDDGEIHYVAGKACRLRLVEDSLRGKVDYDEGGAVLTLHHGPEWTAERRAALLGRWYRKRLSVDLDRLVPAWAARIGVEPSAWSIRAMKSRWGSCHVRTRKLLFSLELAKVDPEGLELVVVHELVHLIVASHGVTFKRHMARHLPDWRQRGKALGDFSRGGGFEPPEGGEDEGF